MALGIVFGAVFGQAIFGNVGVAMGIIFGAVIGAGLSWTRPRKDCRPDKED